MTEIERLRREKISKALKGKKKPPFSAEHIEKLRINSTGKKMSDENKKKLSERMKGNKYKVGTRHTDEWKAKAKLRKPPSLGKPNKLWIGNKNPNWKGGVTPLHYQIRHSLEYKIWRRAVFERDNYTCIWCGFKGYVEADHIKPFCDYPELRFAIDNGRTLCRDCHKKTDTYAKRPKRL